MTYKSFRNKFDSASKFVNRYNLYSLYDGSLDGMSVRTTQKRLRSSQRILNKYGHIDANSSNAFEYRAYLNAKKYNFALFGQLLFKIFSLLAPLIIISVILSKDGNFKFDFFRFVNRFASLQLNFSQPLIDLIKNIKNFMNNYLSFSVNTGNSFEWLINIGKGIANIGLILLQFFTCIGLIFTFIIDFFANVFAFIGALVPGLL